MNEKTIFYGGMVLQSLYYPVDHLDVIQGPLTRISRSEEGGKSFIVVEQEGQTVKLSQRHCEIIADWA